MAAIFTGLELIESSEDSWMPKVMGGFVGWEALFFILMEINSRCNRTGKIGDILLLGNVYIVVL